MRRSATTFYLPLLLLVVMLYGGLYLGIHTVESLIHQSTRSTLLSLTGSRMPEYNQRTFLVTKVIDGDTIEVETAYTRERVRLIGIDTPEVYGTSECYGEEASQRAKELMENTYVRLEADITQNDRDRYGRLLRYVYVDDIMVNYVLLTEGYAHEYTYAVPYLLQTMFREGEREARRFGRGMWSYCSALSSISYTHIL